MSPCLFEGISHCLELKAGFGSAVTDVRDGRNYNNIYQKSSLQAHFFMQFCMLDMECESGTIQISCNLCCNLWSYYGLIQTDLCSNRNRIILLNVRL